MRIQKTKMKRLTIKLNVLIFEIQISVEWAQAPLRESYHKRIMKSKRRFKITAEVRKTTTKEKVIGFFVWAAIIGVIVYLVRR